MHFRFKTANI